MSDWTTDQDGGFVRWNEPPYFVNGRLTLLLEGEDRVDVDELSKRRHEYMKLERRRIKKGEPKLPESDRQKSLF